MNKKEKDAETFVLSPHLFPLRREFVRCTVFAWGLRGVFFEDFIEIGGGIEAAIGGNLQHRAICFGEVVFGEIHALDQDVVPNGHTVQTAEDR